MSIIEFKGRRIELDDDGYLKDFDDWSEELATYFSSNDEIRLTETHWEVIRFVREYYREYQQTPMPKIIIKRLNSRYGSKKYSIKMLYRIFPETPVRLACRYAGIPKPQGCT